MNNISVITPNIEISKNSYKKEDIVKENIVRVMRLLIFEGDRSWVEKQVENSIHGTKIPNMRQPQNKITVRTLEEFPQILEEHITSIPSPLNE